MRTIFESPAENAKIADWLAEQKGFEPSTPTSSFHRKIAREFGGLFCFDKKQQSWRDNHRHIFATLVFSPPHRSI